MGDTSGALRGADHPSEALFGVLGDTTRLQILHTLFRDVGPGTEEAALTFSELYERAEYDTSANFSYHIDRLIEAGLVDRADPGYTLSLPGTMVVRKLLAGWAFVDGEPLIEPTTVDVGCPRCGTPAELAYYGGVLRVHCPECVEGVDGERERAHMSGDHPSPTPFVGMSVPPTGVIDREPDEFLRAACAYFFSRERAHLAGVCPTCACRVTPTVDIRADHGPGTDSAEVATAEPLAIAETICPNCGTHLTLPVRRAIQAEPAVTAFYYDHGVDHEFVSWDAYTRSWDYREEILSVDPIRVRVTVPWKDDRLRLTVDGELTVDEVTEETGPST